MARPALRLPALLAALAVAASLALAGCIGTASATSAKAHQSAADEAAKAWDPDARLAQIIGAEGTIAPLLSLLGAGPSSDFGSADEDQNVGDGLAEVWVYRYVAEGKDQSYVVVVDKAGDVVRKGTEAKGADDRPLGAWDVDSDKALQLALEANEGLRQGVGSSLFGVVTILHQASATSAVWLVAGGGVGSSGAGGGQVVLDAVTGKVLSSEGGSSDADRSWMG